MTTNTYEKTYSSVTNAERNVEYLNALVNILRSNREPMTCADLGRRLFGDRYESNSAKNILSARMGQMLRHLWQGGFIKMERHKGDPIEIEVEDFILDNDTNGEPPRITVYDKQGREYDIPNPNYVAPRRRGHWGMVKKTVTPTIKTYLWVAE